ncbi:thioredoxin [Pectobacterium polaris]|uniref:thioredoxin n=1 Tax=Pectobacterium polaris TaxID=2042057 RepID=UPI002B23F221|nr:thioredoxin [Pectobacterium polaris]
MSDVIIAVTDSSLNRLLQESEVPVLVDLWATWCQPCLMLAPLLEKVADTVANNLTIAKLDVDQYPDVAQKLRVRGIPTLLLFSKGKEISRKVGASSLSDLSGWLRDNGIVVESADEKVSWQVGQSSAFYGDDELATFFSERLKRESAAQRVASYWKVPLEEGKQMLPAALVKQDNLAVFEKVTGIPAVVGKWLYFLDYSEPEAANELAESLTAGKDLSVLPVQLVLTWLQNPRTQWDLWLADDINQLRKRWLALAQPYLNGEETQRKAWLTLHEEIQAYLAPRNNDYTFERFVAMVIGELSPPMSAGIDEAEAWDALIYAIIEAQTRVEQMLSGWTADDFQQPMQRHLWLNERIDRSLPDEEMQQAYDTLLARWSEENEAFVAKETHFYQQQTALLKTALLPLRAQCSRLLKGVPASE